jgi:hypothetical protein
MMTRKELEAFDVPCQYIAGKKIPCVVVKSHLEVWKELEGPKREAEKTQITQPEIRVAEKLLLGVITDVIKKLESENHGKRIPGYVYDLMVTVQNRFERALKKEVPNAKCPDCKGRGGWQGYRQYFICPTCNGTGYVPKPDRTADREAGIFKKPTPEQCRKLAEKLRGKREMNKYQAAIKAVKGKLIRLLREKNDLQSCIEKGMQGGTIRFNSVLEEVTECQQAIELLEREGKNE